MQPLDHRQVKIPAPFLEGFNQRHNTICSGFFESSPWQPTWRVSCQKESREPGKSREVSSHSPDKRHTALVEEESGTVAGVQEAKGESQNAEVRGRRSPNRTWVIDLRSQNNHFLARAPSTVPSSHAQARPHVRQQPPTASAALLLMLVATKTRGTPARTSLRRRS